MSWRVSVAADADATLTWDAADAADEYDLFLHAQRTGVQIDMRRRREASLRELGNGRLTLRAVRREPVPAEAALLANYPNPFNPETWIPFELAEASEVAVAIYAVDGSLVRALDLGRRDAGRYVSRDAAAYWDGRATTGDPAASGVYIYEIRTDGLIARRRMLLRK